MAVNLDNSTPHYYTLEEYSALERGSDARFEYWDGDIVCMSGGSQRHYEISANVHFRLREKLGKGKYRAYTADMPIKTPTLPPYRYPDATVVCGERKFEEMYGVDALINPVLIVEVASPSTATRDEIEKFRAYQALPTFYEYLLISQDCVQVSHYRKQHDNIWVRHDMSDLTAVIAFESIDCSLSLRELYEGVDFTKV